MDIVDRNHHSILGVIVVVSLFLMYIYFSGCTLPRKPESYFYQDLNSVEIIGPGAYDPMVIAAVHHWQKYPFGLSPIMSGIESIFNILAKCFYSFIFLCFVFVISIMK